MNTITYRKAVLEDCLDLAILKGQVWNTTYKGIYSEEKLSGYDIAKNESIFQNIVNNPDIELFVALDNQKIVGLMTCGKPYRPFMDFQQEIGLLYILKEYQRKGIGKTFFEIARNQMKTNRYTKFFLSVNSKNFDAQKFYESMGGVIIYQDDVSIKYSYQV